MTVSLTYSFDVLVKEIVDVASSILYFICKTPFGFQLLSVIVVQCYFNSLVTLILVWGQSLPNRIASTFSLLCLLPYSCSVSVAESCRTPIDALIFFPLLSSSSSSTCNPRNHALLSGCHRWSLLTLMSLPPLPSPLLHYNLAFQPTTVAIDHTNVALPLSSPPPLPLLSSPYLLPATAVKMPASSSLTASPSLSLASTPLLPLPGIAISNPLPQSHDPATAVLSPLFRHRPYHYCLPLQPPCF
ncbi:hypothetical protein B296_00016193 [Ensete ventricosum]|uniref:Uncharacterized protein n=1 Tax=Ensete ventricosum TaxID=4639 RepID=A0A427AWD0_ENSVE|nr:hypothetical protein B296_00016193 [Ensete ventricosum]